jgi:hypothetical protein
MSNILAHHQDVQGVGPERAYQPAPGYANLDLKDKAVLQDTSLRKAFKSRGFIPPSVPGGLWFFKS